MIDFRCAAGVADRWVRGHVRAGEAEVIAETEAAGFGPTERLEFMQTQYFMRFHRD